MMPRFAALSIAEMTARILIASWAFPRNAPASASCADVSQRCDCEVIASVSGGRAWRLISCWPLLNRKIVDVDARGRNRDCQEMTRTATVPRIDYARGLLRLTRADLVLHRSSRHCSATGVGFIREPGVFVALQRALPPFASARP